MTGQEVGVEVRLDSSASVDANSKGHRAHHDRVAPRAAWLNKPSTTPTTRRWLPPATTSCVPWL